MQDYFCKNYDFPRYFYHYCFTLDLPSAHYRLLQSISVRYRLSPSPSNAVKKTVLNSLRMTVEVDDG